MIRGDVKVTWRKLPKLEGRIKRKAEMGVAKMANDLLQTSYKEVVETAFDTGNLANSLDVKQLSAMLYVIFTNVEYAKYVHDGTSKMEARPWFVWSAQEIDPKFRLMMHQIVREACA